MEQTTIWSTRGLELKRALSLWNEAISSAFLKVHTQLRHSAAPFQAHLESKKIGHLSINQLHAQSYQVICNTEVNLNDWLFINLHQAGQCRLQQYGRHLSIAPGDISINLGSSPFIFDFDDGVAMTCLRLPLKGALTRSGLIHDFAARPLPHNAGSHLLRNYLTSFLMNVDQLTPRQVGLAINCLLDLMVMTIEADTSPQFDRKSRQKVQYERACTHIKTHLGNPNLTLSLLSQHLTIAPRTLQNLFQTQGTTFSATLLEARLRAADHLIIKGTYSQFSQIAYAVGFSDQSHFNKAYRRHFNMTPGERRLQAV